LNNDFIQASPAANIRGDRTVASLYAELNLPLFAAKNAVPLVSSLDFDGSVRFEHYSDFGSATKPKFDMNYRPVSWIMLRGSYNEGFRAPNLAMLHLEQRSQVVSYADTYRQPVTGLPSDGNNNRIEVIQGNSNLVPEKSTGESAGIVIDVPKVHGLSLSVDYWQIKQSNVIVADNINNVLAADVAKLTAASQTQIASGTSVSSVNLGSGTSGYLGDSRVTRATATTADQALFSNYDANVTSSQKLGAVGPIQSVTLAYSNANQGFIEGYDIGGEWRLPEMPLGQFTFESNWSTITRAYATVPGSSAQQRQLGIGSGTSPNTMVRWKGNVGVTWRRKSLQAGLSAYYVGHFADTGATATAAQYQALGDPSYIAVISDGTGQHYYYRVSDCLTYNGFLGYSFGPNVPVWLANTDVKLGVKNIANKEPPLTSDTESYNQELYNDLLAGRTWYLKVSRHF
jgi:outer membrane receptor protein involved in Fe transport